MPNQNHVSLESYFIVSHEVFEVISKIFLLFSGFFSVVIVYSIILSQPKPSFIEFLLVSIGLISLSAGLVTYGAKPLIYFGKGIALAVFFFTFPTFMIAIVFSMSTEVSVPQSLSAFQIFQIPNTESTVLEILKIPILFFTSTLAGSIVVYEKNTTLIENIKKILYFHLVAFGSIVLHELGHASVFGFRALVIIYPLGAYVVPYLEDPAILLLASGFGVLVNLLLALSGLAMERPILYELNIMLAIFNWMYFPNTDGYLCIYLSTEFNLTWGYFYYFAIWIFILIVLFLGVRKWQKKPILQLHSYLL